MSGKIETLEQGIPSSILRALSVGDMITINRDNGAVYVAPLNASQYAIAMSTPPLKGVKSTFVITMYSFNGSNEAKISLQPLGMDGYYWVAGQSGGSLINPILLGQKPGHFSLTDVGGGQISIKNSFVPPGPYIRGQGNGAHFLSYGFGDSSFVGF